MFATVQGFEVLEKGLVFSTLEKSGEDWLLRLEKHFIGGTLCGEFAESSYSEEDKEGDEVGVRALGSG